MADVTVADMTTAVPIPHLAAGFSRGPDITLSLLSAPVDTRTSRCGLAPSPAGGLVRLATGGGLQLAKVSLAPESGCVAFKSPKPHCFLADVNPGGVEPCASPGRAAALCLLLPSRGHPDIACAALQPGSPPPSCSADPKAGQAARPHPHSISPAGAPPLPGPGPAQGRQGPCPRPPQVVCFACGSRGIYSPPGTAQP